jgi:FMN-dependent NADH-azoreductase
VNNFSVPSTLKSWIDHIVRIRRTFVSTPEGKVGQLRDRPVLIVASHGGDTSGGCQPDYLTDHLRAIFETIGIRQVHFLCAGGLSRGPESIERVLTHAKAWIDEPLPL